MKLIRYPFLIIPVLLLLLSNSSSSLNEEQASKHISLSPLPGTSNEKGLLHFTKLYDQWNLQAAGLSKEAFEMAWKGYSVLDEKNSLTKNNLLTIIDYSKPSTEKRLFVLDMTTGEVLFNSLVAHGRRSGQNYATDFSNKEDSHQSSLGFYVTLNTYFGENGYSLKLKGCETGINDKAYNRAIVMHGADYVSEKFIRQNGYLGRSYGCPAVPKEVSKKIIDVIKEGSCMFLYYPSKKYSIQSKILNS